MTFNGLAAENMNARRERPPSSEHTVMWIFFPEKMHFKE